MGGIEHRINISPSNSASTTNSKTKLYDLQLVSTGYAGAKKIQEQLTFTDLPKATFQLTEEDICEPISVSFSNSNSDIAAQIYHWDFGGEEMIVENEEEVTYLTGGEKVDSESFPIVTFDKPGTYTIQLIASSICGADTSTDTFSKAVEVLPNPIPKLDFQYSGLVCTGDTVQFTNTAIGHTTTLWDWGDGTPIDTIEESPDTSHTYAVGALEEAMAGMTFNLTMMLTKDSMRKDDLSKNFKILHLATHGCADNIDQGYERLLTSSIEETKKAKEEQNMEQEEFNRVDCIIKALSAYKSLLKQQITTTSAGGSSR